MNCSSCDTDTETLTPYVSPYQPGTLHLCPNCAGRWVDNYDAKPVEEARQELDREIADRMLALMPEIDELLGNIVNERASMWTDEAGELRHAMRTGEREEPTP